MYMKKRFLFLVLTAIVSFSVFGQKGGVVTPSYYDVIIDGKIYEIVAPNNTIDNFIDDTGSEVSQTAGEIKEGVSVNPIGQFDRMARAGILEKTKQVFKEKLDIEIAPMNALEGKINFSTGGYPSQNSFKKVIKKAAGEDYYFFYMVSIEDRGGLVGGGIDIGGNVKPVITIKLAIADNKGKKIQEFEVKEKSSISLGSTKTSVGNIDTSSGENPAVVYERFIEAYSDALDALVEDYLKKNKKAYK